MKEVLTQAQQYAAERGESTVTMVFPRKVILLTDSHRRLEFEPGPQEVPESLADHFYLGHCGAVRYAPNRPEESKAAESEKEPDEAVARSTPQGGEPPEKFDDSEAEPGEEAEEEAAEEVDDAVAEDKASRKTKKKGGK